MLVSFTSTFVTSDSCRVGENRAGAISFLSTSCCSELLLYRGNSLCVHRSLVKFIKSEQALALTVESGSEKSQQCKAKHNISVTSYLHYFQLFYTGNLLFRIAINFCNHKDVVELLFISANCKTRRSNYNNNFIKRFYFTMFQ